MPDIDVQIPDGAWQTDTEDPLSMTRRIVGALDTHLGDILKTRELTVRFASDAEVRALNKQFRDQDRPTNVLSFPATPATPATPPASGAPERASAALGDIILARETVLKEATEQGKSLADHASHLVLHGLLHLLGYDHDTDEATDIMEKLERNVLAGINVNDPYAEHTEPAHGE